jgi:hypothetical protein
MQNKVRRIDIHLTHKFQVQVSLDGFIVLIGKKNGGRERNRRRVRECKQTTWRLCFVPAVRELEFWNLNILSSSLPYNPCCHPFPSSSPSQALPPRIAIYLQLHILLEHSPNFSSLPNNWDFLGMLESLSIVIECGLCHTNCTREVKLEDGTASKWP